MRAWLLLLCCLSLQAQPKGSLMAVFAHPDDETIVGALLARYAREGYRVHVVTITNGDRGKTPNTTLENGPELGAAREKEWACSMQKLGIAEHTMLSEHDASLSDPRVIEMVGRKVLEKINAFKPGVLLTWGPDGVTGHPDHRAASNITTQLFSQRAALAHKPRKLYYIAMSERQFEGAEMDGRRVPFRLVADELITTWVDCRKYSAAAFAAIQCHKTQWDTRRMEWNQQMFEKIQEGKVTLRLAMTDLPFPKGRETDIFEGLRQ